MVDLEYTQEGRALLILNGRYRLWRDPLTFRWRWARSIFPDDGVGCASHGSEPTRQRAAGAAVAHFELMQRVANMDSDEVTGGWERVQS